MRTTMSLDGVLIKELMQVTGAKTRTEAIHLAISEFIRRKKLEGLNRFLVDTTVRFGQRSSPQM